MFFEGTPAKTDDAELIPPDQPRPFQRFLYWLAGARWELLAKCPASEQERMAVLGSTVLVPTIMAFLGMFFFVRSRFTDPPFFSAVAVSLLWAFVILNTDRVLIALYRPFQPFWRRCIQVAFRLGLAGVVSLAITFPFCLDQYRPAIRFRYQGELQGKLNALRTAEADGRRALRENLTKIRDTVEADRRKIETDALAQRESLSAQLPALERAQLNPELYADEKMEAEKRRATANDFVAPATGATLNIIAKVDAQKDTVEQLGRQLEESRSMHRRLVEAIAREELGQPNEFYPEPKKPGDGPRLKDMKLRDSREEAKSRALEASLQQANVELNALGEALAKSRLSDRNAFLDALNSKRESFVQEAGEQDKMRRQRLQHLQGLLTQNEERRGQLLEKLTAYSQALEEEHARAQQRHDETHLPPIRRLEDKISGIFDPMEETIGLYKVIFQPPADMPEEAKLEYRWAAGLFQFLVVFSTLFLLDLIPIVAKLLSRAGAYDVLVEHTEFVANTNWADFSRHFREHGNGWPGTTATFEASMDNLLRPHYRPPTAPAPAAEQNEPAPPDTAPAPLS